MKKVLLSAVLAASMIQSALASDQELWGCHLESGKMVMVTGLGQGDNPTLAIGDAPEPEEVYLIATPHNKVKFNYDRTDSGELTYLRFTSGTIDYVVHETFGRGKTFVGIKLFENGKLFADAYCTSAPVGILTAPVSDVVETESPENGIKFSVMH